MAGVEFIPRLPGKISFILPKGPSRLVCFYANQQQLKDIRKSIRECWKDGIESEMVKTEECTEFKMYGRPLGTHDNGTSTIAVMKLYSSIINRYYKRGWRLIAATLMSHWRADDPVLIFRKIVNPVPYPIVSISTSFFHIHIENAPEQLTPIVQALAERFLDHEIKHVKQETDTSATIKLKSKGLFGLSEGEAWPFINNLLRDLHNNHYVVYSSIPISYHAFDMLFFQYMPILSAQEIFTMVLNGDVIQLQDTNVRINSVIENAVHDTWSKGYQKKFESETSMLLKLKGQPFLTGSDEECVATDALFTKIFAKIASLGYYVVSSFTEVCREKQLVFRKEKQEREKAQFFCLNTTYRSVRLIKAPEEIIEATAELAEDMRLLVKQDTKISPGCCYELKLKERGAFERVESIDTYNARCFLAGLMGAYTELRYNFVVSASLHSVKGSKTSSWFFMFDDEEVTFKQQLKVEAQSRSPSPHRSSSRNGPNRSPHLQHSHPSPRISPRSFKKKVELPITPFLHPETNSPILGRSVSPRRYSRNSPNGSPHLQHNHPSPRISPRSFKKKAELPITAFLHPETNSPILGRSVTSTAPFSHSENHIGPFLHTNASIAITQHSETPTVPFLHSGERHLLPFTLIDTNEAPPSYEEAMKQPRTK